MKESGLYGCHDFDSNILLLFWLGLFCNQTIRHEVACWDVLMQ